MVNVRPEPPIRRVLYPITEFMHREAAGGIVLMLSAVVALVWANSPWAEAYVRLWGTTLTVGPDNLAISKDVRHWINDGLMAIFFFVVGLEIKREVMVGELSSLRAAILPAAAALGGALVPALIYVAFNSAGEGLTGWGVPMATDIAFTLGVLALLGSRVPTSLKVFLTALAIVDDLGAVLVIALFYTDNISWLSLAVAAIFLAALIALNRAGARHPIAYALLGIGLWVAFLKSGMHATIAGVLLAMTIPAYVRIDIDEFIVKSNEVLSRISRSRADGEDSTDRAMVQQASILELEALCEHVQTPLHRLEHTLHPWVAFAIVPLFALANAGVALEGDMGTVLTNSVTLGIIAGLVLGKQIGITLFAWLAVRTGYGELPAGVGWKHIYGASWLAGIGFTMSLFIAGLAFGEGPLLDQAKVGILAASLISGAVGWTILRRVGAPRVSRDAALSQSDRGAE